MDDLDDLLASAVVEPARDPRWVAVGRTLAARMLDYYDLQADFSKASGVSPTSLSRILRGQPVVRRDKRRALARALYWPDDAIERLLAGESAADLPTTGDATPPRRLPLDLATRVEYLERRLAVLEERLDRMGGVQP